MDKATKTTTPLTLYCTTCNETVKVISIRQDVFGGSAAVRVYYCPKAHEVVEAI